MTVIVLTNCPAGLRGFLTRWLIEISAGVFIGNPSARIRDLLWEEVQQYAGQGRALLAHTTNNEQGFTFRTHDHGWHPVDHEGLTLIRRPSAKETKNRRPKVRLEQCIQASPLRKVLNTIMRRFPDLPESVKVLQNAPRLF